MKPVKKHTYIIISVQLKHKGHRSFTLLDDCDLILAFNLLNQTKDMFCRRTYIHFRKAFIYMQPIFLAFGVVS